MECQRLYKACFSGDANTFLQLVQEDESILDQKLLPSSNSVLHLASRFGHVFLVSEIIKLRFSLVSEVNERLETPVHEACRQGHFKVVELLLNADPEVVCLLNGEKQSPLYVACRQGHFNLVKYLLKKPNLLELELDCPSTSLHVAASEGHTGIVVELLKQNVDVVWKKDAQGLCPIHLASSKGHIDIIKEFIKVDPDLCCITDDDFRRTPVHLAAIKGQVSALDIMLSSNLESAEILTGSGESVLHLGVKNNHLETVEFLIEKLDAITLINISDCTGNTVVHIAAARKLSVVMSSRYVYFQLESW